MDTQRAAPKLLLTACLLCLVALPFVIGDLYFAFENPKCVRLPISNTKISFNLSTWLKVNGLLSLMLMLLLLGLALAIWRTTSNNYQHLFFGYLITLTFTAAFRICWTIVGAIMFWGFLYPSRCESNLNAYMFATLIVGSALVFANCLATRRQSDMEMHPIAEETS